MLANILKISQIYLITVSLFSPYLSYEEKLAIILQLSHFCLVGTGWASTYSYLIQILAFRAINIFEPQKSMDLIEVLLKSFLLHNLTNSINKNNSSAGPPFFTCAAMPSISFARLEISSPDLAKLANFGPPLADFILDFDQYPAIFEPHPGTTGYYFPAIFDPI